MQKAIAFTLCTVMALLGAGMLSCGIDAWNMGVHDEAVKLVELSGMGAMFVGLFCMSAVAHN